MEIIELKVKPLKWRQDANKTWYAYSVDQMFEIHLFKSGEIYCLIKYTHRQQESFIGENFEKVKSKCEEIHLQSIKSHCQTVIGSYTNNDIKFI